ncbi:lasso peptide isopeptide bond-forming cyclase [Streptomyces sp. DH37]|uniref:lasso peptide isopeptide bond-forming cyclase n=1 Tax=Streptomyces sp. DH37 TaxID=3040122 RepID=UPI00244197B9|nr:lasso peptide isopeptide bond-forming cyclase [Streptomyces sp. DH37]MDG9703236.1 lasso peptide isopeptide bond-forming cyclase [Streptomyces sp. DH37]
MGDLVSPALASRWFVVLPDSDAAAGLAGRARTHASGELRHHSGRPWVLGRWARGELTVGECADARVAVLGEHRVTAGEASRAAAGARESPAALDRLTAAWPGSFHVVASAAGRVRMRGGVAGMRRVFHGRTGPVTVAGDRADVVAELLGAELDERRLAAQLLTLGLLHPLSGQPLWHGVERLPGDHSLLIPPDGPARRTRRWTAPEPDVPLAEGAAALAEELTAAVDVRTRGRALVTADLGGLDSTAVCCAAARGTAEVVAYTAATHDPLGDDVHWARRTVAALGNVEHHLVPAERVPLTYEGLGTLGDHLDAPCLMAVDRNRRMSLLEMAAERGSTLHLTGLGGDELLGGAAAHLHAMVRTHPLAALRRLRGYTAKYGWSRRRVLHQLLDRRSYPAWLRKAAADLRRPPPPEREPLLEWSPSPRLPPWATPDAADAVRELVLAEAPAAEPLAPGRGHGAHREMATMDLVSRFARHIGQMAEPLGVVCAAPYYDDRIVETCLAVRPLERVTPYRYKPLIVEATRGIVPEASRTRATKANATLEEEVGLRRHRDQLLALCEDSRLGRMGLVDVTELRRWCGRPLSPEAESELLHPTVACEVWLRSREGATAPPRTTP